MSNPAATMAIPSTPYPADGVVSGMPRWVLQMEGAAALAASVLGYAQLGQGWGLFALLFLLPDLSMLGYLRDRRFGAAVYNVGHSYLLPGALFAAGVLSSQSAMMAIALIWTAHIGFDRAVGYGLKYPTAFRHTHLGSGFGKPAVR